MINCLQASGFYHNQICKLTLDQSCYERALIPMPLSTYGHSDVGFVRENNEDSFSR